MITKISIGAFLLLLTISAQAEVINQFTSFATNSTADNPIESEFFILDPFDTTLGKLDKVIFNIEGQITMGAGSTLNLLPVGGLGTLAPVPYDYLLKMEMDIMAISAFNFDFATNAEFLLPGAATGSDTSILPRSVLFSLTAEFNELSDLIGQDIPSTSGNYIPPATVLGTRGGFEENLITSTTGLQFQMLNTTTATENAQVATLFPFAIANGVIRLTYDYTLSPVPIPAAVWLFGTALIGLVGFSKRRQAA